MASTAAAQAAKIGKVEGGFIVLAGGSGGIPADGDLGERGWGAIIHSLTAFHRRGQKQSERVYWKDKIFRGWSGAQIKSSTRPFA